MRVNYALRAPLRPIELGRELVYSNDDREKVKASEMKAHELTVDVLSYAVLIGNVFVATQSPAVHLEASDFGRLPSSARVGVQRCTNMVNRRQIYCQCISASVFLIMDEEVDREHRFVERIGDGGSKSARGMWGFDDERATSYTL